MSVTRKWLTTEDILARQSIRERRERRIASCILLGIVALIFLAVALWRR